MPRNVAFSTSRKSRVAPLTPPEARLLDRLRSLRHLAMAWFSTLFALLWPVYAGWEIWHHIHQPNRLEDGWNIIVILLSFLYGAILWTRLHPQTVYPEAGPPPTMVIHEHRHRRRW